MFGKLFSKLRSGKTITARNLRKAYLLNGAEIARSVGRKIIPAKDISLDRKLYVLEFKGDVLASKVDSFSEEVSSIIAIGDPQADQVLIKVQSPGGAAHMYGYAAAQIERLCSAGFYVITSVDKIAASGGYMMACVADKIISAPYAVVGSIGVVAEFPNVNRLLDSVGVDYKQYTAGKFKRTVSVMGEITPEGEAEFKSDLSRMHSLFKEHVAKYRAVDIESVANGKHWMGAKAKSLGLVDDISTSDALIMKALKTFEVIEIKTIEKSAPFGFLGKGFVGAIADVVKKVILELHADLRFM